MRSTVGRGRRARRESPKKKNSSGQAIAPSLTTQSPHGSERPPTTHASKANRKEGPDILSQRGRGDGCGLGVGVGRGVPAALFTIAPNVPTAVALFGSGQDTPQSPSATPLRPCCQELPPSVVRKTMITETNSGSVIRIGKGNGREDKCSRRRLRDPAISAVCCSENYSLTSVQRSANCDTMVRVSE